jgi:UDP-glucose 4-epimerase
MKQRLLITGGAGYIGSVLTAYLLDHGYEVVVIDDLTTGHSNSIDSRASFVEASILDKPQLTKALIGIDTVIHCAAKSLVEESVAKPEIYHQINTDGIRILLDAMSDAGVKNIIFSSTAAVYGHAVEQPITENTSLEPVNPYGKSKAEAEQLITNYCNRGVAAITFRYFNVAGSYQTSNGQLFFENHKDETHLIPKVMKNIIKQQGNNQIEVYGDEWPTKDGSCVRDYLHIVDLAYAHLLALTKLEVGTNKVFNLGSGGGYSVFEVLGEIEKVVGVKLNHLVSKPRAGDPAVLVAAIDKAIIDLGWKPKATLSEIITDSWQGVKQLG